MKYAVYPLVLACLVMHVLIENEMGHTTAQTFDYTEWETIPPEEIVVNLYDLRDARAVGTQMRTRDNALVEQRARLLLGAIQIQHVPANLFNLTGTASIRDRAEVEDRVRESLGDEGKAAELTDSRNLHGFKVRGGWLLVFDLAGSGRTCYMSETGFLSDPGKNWYAGERYDTFVSFYDCSERRSLYEIETWLKGLSIVSSEYKAGRLTK